MMKPFGHRTLIEPRTHIQLSLIQSKASVWKRILNNMLKAKMFIGNPEPYDETVSSIFIAVVCLHNIYRKDYLTSNI